MMATLFPIALSAKAPALGGLDLGIVALYFLLIFATAGWLIWKDRRKKKNSQATTDYFLGGKNLGWFVIGASLFASNIGSEHLVGLAGAGASGDFPAAQMEILAALMLLLLGWLFVPFYLRSGVYTMPEFLELRYNRWSRDYLSWVSIVAYVLTKISVTIAAGGIICTALLGINFWTGAILIVVATGIYTVLGGLKAVLYTDMLQMFILLGGAVAVVYFGLEAAGGWSGIKAQTGQDYLSLWRPATDPDFPWTGILLGAPILGVWYWCTDQFIVQRVLAARDIDAARSGTIFAGFLKLLPLFIFVIPGVIAYALAQGDNPALVFPTHHGKPLYDAALPLLTTQLLPSGFKGLVVAGLLAALMSSLSSVFNSCSTLFTFDIYQKYFPNTSDRKLVQVGQLATALLVVLGLLWIPLLQKLEGGLFQKLQSIQAYISPPIAAVFLMGLFNRNLNGHGAKASLLAGAFLGTTRLALEVSGLSLPAGLQWFVTLNFLHFALFLFLTCALILYTVSLRYSQSPTAEVKALTFVNELRMPAQPRHVVMSLVLVAAVLALWFSFR